MKRPARCSSSLDTLDGYAKWLWRAKLASARSVDSTLRLVWMYGFSVPAARAAVGDYVRDLQTSEISQRAHLCDREASMVLDELVDDGLLEPLACRGTDHR